MNASIVSKKKFTNSRDTSFSDDASRQALHVFAVSERMRAEARITVAVHAKSLVEKNAFFAALGLEN